jgi:hypothetical protein
MVIASEALSSSTDRIRELCIIPLSCHNWHIALLSSGEGDSRLGVETSCGKLPGDARPIPLHRRTFDGPYSAQVPVQTGSYQTNGKHPPEDCGCDVCLYSCLHPHRL